LAASALSGGETNVENASLIKRYGIAIAAAVVALLLRNLLSPLLGASHPYVIVCSAVIFSVWCCGTGPAVVTALAGLLGIQFWLLPHARSLALQNPKSETTGIVTFLLLCAFIIALGESHRRAQARLKSEIAERRTAEKALRASEERLRFVADRAQAGFWHWDLLSDRVEWSPLCKQLFGIPPSEIISYARFLAAVHPDDREATDLANRSYLASGGGPDYEKDYRVLWPDGTIRWIHAKGSATFENGKPLRMAGIVLDVTDRKHTESKMQANEERLRMAHRVAHSGAWEVDCKSKEILCSPEFEALWGLVPGTVADPRRRIRQMIYPEDYPIVDKALKDALSNPGGEYYSEYRITHTDGGMRWMESFGEVIRDQTQAPARIVGVTIDITPRKLAEEALRKSHLELEQRVAERTRELSASLMALESEVEIRKQTEESLQALSARLLWLQDEERRRIARDLHDSTGQTLAALKMTLAALESLVSAVPEAPKMLEELNSFTDDALKDIRTTSHLLHPPLLDEVGFTSAARWYVDGFAKRSGIQARLELDAAASGLSKSAELVLFRVLQESLTNVQRHSGSAAVDIFLTTNNEESAVLSIRDYGRGIPAEKLILFHETGAGVGVGLGGMKQRLRELGGHLLITCDGTGTCVQAKLPIAPVNRIANQVDGDAVQGIPAD
jgi:PAS domain S-box-containing protein